MPKRLYWRAAIILLFPVIFLQLIVSVVIIKRHFEGVTEQMTRTVASQIELIATTVEKTEIETCLLYTSPSPRDATLSRMPSSA